MIGVETKYINLFSSRLPRFKKKKEGEYNFRCIYCGDSKSKKSKARGYFYADRKKNTHFYHCHNCGKHLGFKKFLQEQDISLFRDMIKDILTFSSNFKEPEEKETFEEYNETVLKNLKRINELPPTHPVLKYLARRKIPESFYNQLRYAPKFNAWVNTVRPKFFNEEALKNDEPRLVIPYITDGKVIAVQGRSFDPKQEVKYITISFSKGNKLFNHDNVEFGNKYYVLEGPIDAMFLPNATAVGSSALASLDKYKENAILVFDNEPRNKEICKKIERTIDQGFSVVVWPTSPDSKEDINEMVLAGEDVLELITKNTYRGLEAKLRFNKWKRI